MGHADFLPGLQQAVHREDPPPGGRVSIMQPYFLPYIGYFQLIQASDTFVVYDNIKYTKKGWINRNRFLLNGADALFTLPLAQGSDSLDVRQRFLATEFRRDKLLRQLEAAYRRAPQFGAMQPHLSAIIGHPAQNLFDYLLHALQATVQLLEIPTRIVVSSTVDIDHTLSCEDKVIALCRALGARTYLNPIGGLGLYDPLEFQAQGLDLVFLQSRSLVYPQFGHPFVPSLSILDVLMFNPLEQVRQWVRQERDLLQPPLSPDPEAHHVNTHAQQV